MQIMHNSHNIRMKISDNFMTKYYRPNTVPSLKHLLIQQHWGKTANYNHLCMTCPPTPIKNVTKRL